MHATLLGVPSPERGLLEQRLHGGARQAEACHVHHVSRLELLVGELPAGLVVLWDEGGALQEVVERCRVLHARRASEHTLLVVLTRRGPEEAEALAEAGADECVVPPGEHWGARLRALQRRLEESRPAPASARHRQRKAQQKLAARMAPLGLLAAGLAHELNNPLAYVSSNLRYLGNQLAGSALEPGELAELREVLAETQQGVEQIRATVQALDTFARPDEPQPESVDVQGVVESALRLVRNMLQHRTRLEYSLSPVPLVESNAARMGQVLVHLLVSALQDLPARPAGENYIRLLTRCESSGQVVVEVEHNGRAPSCESQARLFAPFFLTASLGGQLEVLDGPSLGGTYRLVLPVALAQEEPLAPAGLSLPHSRSSPWHEPGLLPQ